MAVLAALKSSRKKTIPTIQPKIWPTAGENVAVANCSPMKRNMSSLRCPSTAAMSPRFVRCSVLPSTEGSESIAQPSERRAEHNLDRHRCNRLERLARDTRVFHCRSGIEFHHAGEIRDRLRARQRQDHAHKLHPHRAQALVSRLEKMRGEVRHAHRDQNHDHDRGRHRQRHSETAGMFRPKIIDQTHDQQARQSS